MRSLIGAALLLTSDATIEETSLMQSLVRRGQIAPDAKTSRKDATAKLMETATNMIKNGATPDVITFIETTITEVNQNVLGTIVQEHHRDQQLIDDLLARFDAAVTAMEACAASVRQAATDTDTASNSHKICRSAEAVECARSRKCEDELEELWRIVKTRESEMREIHWAIHGEWCAEIEPPHPGLDDPFNWVPGTYMEGPETSQSTHEYPTIDYTPAVISFRSFSVEQFGHYILKLPEVEIAWENYNRKLLECAAQEETWTLKVDECDGLQDTLRDQACAHAGANRQCASNFGHEYHMTMVAYTAAVDTIRQLEYDRKREWETLHIVTCLLETVYTHVIHSIDSGEPCPTTESHPEQTEQEINYCHVVEESMTANLTIDYGEPPPVPEIPPPQPFPCDAAFIAEESTFTADIISSHSTTITTEGLEEYFTVVSQFGWAGCAAPKACVPCELDELVVDPTYVENEVCKHHHAHLEPGQMDIDSFKCLSGDECIRSSGRCNGVNNCDDGSDETGCSTEWGVPAVLGNQECQVPFNADAQFQCTDGSCVHVAGRCNGISNCADGSDEAGCATTTVHMTVEAMTGYTATIISPGEESLVFSDRSYTFDNLGSFTGYSYVHMSNEDKHTHNTHVQMKLRFDAPTVVYIVKLDTHPLAWLASEGWARSSLTGVSYSGIHQTRHTEWDEELLTENHYGPGEVYEKIFPAGAVELRGNNGGDGSYLIFVANPAHTPTPPDEDLWRPVLGSESGQRVKCNNNIDMVYVADQLACQMLASANGHPFYSFRHNGEGAGHKCMSSEHCDDHLTERTNEWHIYSSAPEPFVPDFSVIRLSDGPDQSSGRLEVLHNGEWGTVCDDGFDITDARVVCRQMGFATAIASYQRAHFGQGSGQIWLDDMACTGDESTVAECQNSGAFGQHNCGHHEDVSVECSNSALPPFTEIRLNGGSSTRGRLEIFYNDQWGTICDDAFDMNDAQVACRQLGFSRAVAQIQSFGGGEGQIWLDNMLCDGSEATIGQCPNRAGFGSHNCRHTEDVGVECA